MYTTLLNALVHGDNDARISHEISVTKPSRHDVQKGCFVWSSSSEGCW